MSGTEPGATEGPPTFDEGRYLYCVVRVDDERATGDGRDGSVADGSPFSPDSDPVTGVDGEPVSLVVEDDVGAVTHATDGIYDTGDLAQLRRWLVRHQLVVDEAGELGTPIPFQFDTILTGDDDALRAWLREEYETLDHALAEFADHWEYRVEVVETEPATAEDLRERDGRLAELDERIGDATAGTAFLLEKQVEKRVRELRDRQRESTTTELVSRLESVAREVHQLDRSPTAPLATGQADSQHGVDDLDDARGGPDDGETLCRLTILAHGDDEVAVGSVLDEIASADGIEVRFTGPWPPYTFAPALGDATAEGDR